MVNIRRIGINMISGGTGYLFSMIINVVSTPFILRELGDEAFGLQAIANVIIGYFIVADMGMDIPITQKVAEFHATSRKPELSNFLSATLKIYLLIGLLGMLLLIALTENLVVLLAIPENMVSQAETIFYLSGVGFLGSLINMWGKAVYGGLHRFDISNGLGIFNNIIGLSTGILLIYLGYGVVEFFLARVAGFLITNVTSFVFIRRHISRFVLLPFIDRDIWRLLKSQIGYGFMLRMSGMVFSRMDQTLISAWIGIAAVTVYSIPILVATTLTGLVANVTKFTFPIFSAMKATSSAAELKSFFTRISKITVVISTMIFVPFIVLGSNFMAYWLNPEIAASARNVLFLLTISFYINACLNVIVNSMIVGVGQLRFFTIYMMLKGIFLLVCFIVLIRLLGIEGAGLSYVAALLIDSIFVVYTIKRKLNINPVHLFKTSYIRPALIGMVTGTLLFLLQGWVTDWITLAAAVTLFELLYLFLIYYFNVIDATEKQKLQGLYKKVTQLLT